LKEAKPLKLLPASTEIIDLTGSDDEDVVKSPKMQSKMKIDPDKPPVGKVKRTYNEIRQESIVENFDASFLTTFPWVHTSTNCHKRYTELGTEIELSQRGLHTKSVLDVCSKHGFPGKHIDHWNGITCTLAASRSNPLTYGDLLGMKSDRWMNDIILNRFLAILSVYQHPGTYFFHSYFFEALLPAKNEKVDCDWEPFKSKYDFRKVQRYIKGFVELPDKRSFRQVNQVNLFENDGIERIFIPINERDSHWLSIVVSLNDKVIYILDSLGYSAQDSKRCKQLHLYGNAIAQFLRDMYRYQHKNESGEHEVSWVNRPLFGQHVQEDSTSCGVFVCFSAYLTMIAGLIRCSADNLQSDDTDTTQQTFLHGFKEASSHIDKVREWILLCVIENRLLVGTVYPPDGAICSMCQENLSNEVRNVFRSVACSQHHYMCKPCYRS